MSRHGVVGSADTHQNPNFYIPLYSFSIFTASTPNHTWSELAASSSRSRLVTSTLDGWQEIGPPSLIIRDARVTQDNAIKHLISLVRSACSRYVVEYAMNIPVDKPSIPKPVVVPPPKKRILASISVELSPKDFGRRVPKPVISL